MLKRDLWRETLSYVNAVLYKEKFFESQDIIKVQMINEMRTHISKIDFSGIKITFLISIHVKYTIQVQLFALFEEEFKTMNDLDIAQRLNSFYECVILKILRRTSKQRHKIEWKTFLHIISVSEFMLKATSDFYIEKQHNLNLSPNFIPEIQNCFDLTLHYYLMKHFLPFLREMGGWDDLQNYYDWHFNKSKKGRQTKFYWCAFTVFALLVYKMY